MRSSIALVPALVLAAVSGLSAQCTPSVQKLITEQKYDEAKAEVQALLKSNGSDDVALHCMGMIYVSEKPDASVEWFERAVKANDKSSAHHLWLGNALGEQASHTSKFKLPFIARRVKTEFEKAVELDPSSIEARHGLIQFYSQAPGVMGGSMEKAKEQAREIAKLSPMQGHIEMAALLERDKDMTGAEREYTAGLAAAPDSMRAPYNALGNFYRRQKRYADAVAVYERLLKVHPDATNAHLLIAWNLRLSGEDIERAEREVKLWLSEPPKNASKQNLSFGHALLGDIYARRSNKDAARGEYQAALVLDPNNKDARKGIDALK